MIRAQAAQILDVFHIGVDGFAKMTDSQIHRVCFHKRDKEGHILLPVVAADEQKEPTLENDLVILDKLRAMGIITQQHLEECQAKVKDKFAAKAAKDKKCPD